MLKLEKINKKLKNFSLNNIGFTVNKGDYFILIGESGAGKTMLLEIITGLLVPDTGTIILKGKVMKDIPVQKRNIGLVYQKPTLFPHMSVYENIAYPLKIRKYTKEEINIKVKQLANDTEITHLLDRNIFKLSGGEAQRITIARTLATNPDILLLDEPLSFLDVQLRKGMLSLLRKLNKNGQTIIQVTHDYEEALALANKIAIIEKGTIIQTGSPNEVLHNPKSTFVANFVGIKNFYKGKIINSDDKSGLCIFQSSGVNISITTNDKIYLEGYIIIPGEAIILSEEKLNSSAVNNFKGTIKDIYPTKQGIEIVLDIGIEIAVQITSHSNEKLNLCIGKKVWISFKASSITFVKD